MQASPSVLRLRRSGRRSTCRLDTLDLPNRVRSCRWRQGTRNRSKERHMIEGSQLDFESARSASRRRFAKVAVAALAIIGFAGAGLSGALAHDDDGWDDDVVFAPSGGFLGYGRPGGV